MCFHKPSCCVTLPKTISSHTFDMSLPAWRAPIAHLLTSAAVPDASTPPCILHPALTNGPPGALALCTVGSTAHTNSPS